MSKKTVIFSKSSKGNDFICRINGKISFIERLYRGISPKEGELWAVEIKKELDKVNIVLPLFRVNESTPVENLLKLDDFYVRLDFFNNELLIFKSGRHPEIFKKFPYDGRWDDRMFYSDYRFPEAIRLHVASKGIVESGKTALIVDNNGKLVKLSPGSIGRNFNDYGYYCHIHNVNGDEKNFVFVDAEAERKWNELTARNKLEFLEKMVSPPTNYWNNEKVARTIGFAPERSKIVIQTPQKLIGSSEWNDSYYEVFSTSCVSYRNTPIEGETACQACGSTSKAMESEYTVYYEHRGSAEMATHKGLGKCRDCGATQDQWWGEEGNEITDLPNFPDSDGGKKARWKTGEDEAYHFPYEDDCIKGELMVVVSPRLGATYLQKYKIYNIKSRYMRIFQVKKKCMRPNFITSSYVEIPGRGSGNIDLKIREVAYIWYEEAEFPADFTLQERYICGWLPEQFY